MITDDQYKKWLEDPSVLRVSLFRIKILNSAGAPITLYLSNRDYKGGDANTPYLAIVEGSVSTTESISYDSEAKLTVGAISMYNDNGEISSWLSYIWQNGEIDVYGGDPRWDFADFRQVFSGRIDSIDGTKSRDRLAIKIRDILQDVNTPVTDEKMSTSPTPDTLRPKLLGEVHNLTPKLKNANTGEYEFNGGESEDLIEARCDAKPRAVTKNLSVGSFTFTGDVGPGTVTCSAQGVKYNGVYANTISKLVQYLVTQCGKASTRLTAADLDTVNLADFDTAHPQPVGLFLSDRENVVVAAGRLAASVGAQLIPSSLGKLRLIQYNIPTSATTVVTDAQVHKDSAIRIVAHSKVQAAVKIGYCKNWTVQDNLQTSIPNNHKALYAQEWLSVTPVNQATKTLYKLDEEPVQRDTCLQRKIDADAEGDRCLNIVSVPRTTYGFTGLPELTLLQLGQAVTLVCKDYEELKNGKVGQVTSLTRNWDTFLVDIQVTV